MKKFVSLVVAVCMVFSLAAGFVGTALAYEEPPEMTLPHVKGYNQEVLDMLSVMDEKTLVDYSILTITPEQFEEIGAAAKEIVDGAQTEYEKVYRISKWVHENVRYSYEGTDQNPYTVFKEKVAICQGYSNLVKAMLSYLEIPCILVNGDSIAGGHAWNMAYADGEWIFVDSTWGTFGETVEEFSKTHRPYYSDSIRVNEGDYRFTYNNGIAVDAYLGEEKEWVIPSSFRGLPVSSISQNMFYFSSDVEKIVFPATLKNLDSGYNFKMFSSLKEIVVDEKNAYFSSEDGVFYDKDKKELLVYPAGKEDEKFAVPGSVTTLGETLFYENPYVKEVLIPPSVTSIGKEIFRNPQEITVYAEEESYAESYAKGYGIEVKPLEEFDDGSEEPGQTVSTAILEYALQLAKNVDTDNVIASVAGKFEQAYAKAQNTLKRAQEGDETLTQSEVDQSWKNLIEAMQYLSFKIGDKTQLKKVIEAADRIDLTLYMEEGKAAFEQALKDAYETVQSEDVLQAEVDSAWQNLLKAMSELRLKPDKSLLEKLVKTAQGLKPDLFEPESYRAVQTALMSAVAVMEDESAELQEVEKAQKDLESALKGLVAVKGEKEAPVAKQEVIAKTTETEKKSAADEKIVKSVKTGDEAKAATSALMAMISAAVFGMAVAGKRRK